MNEGKLKQKACQFWNVFCKMPRTLTTKDYWVVYIFILTIAVTVITAAQQLLSWEYYAFFGCIAVVSFVVIVCKRSRQQSPAPDNATDAKGQISISGLDSLTYRYARRSDIHEIVNIDRDWFRPHEIISADVFLKWHSKNSKVFSCMFYQGELVGYCAILPLAPKTLKSFCKGQIEESEFGADDILPLAKMKDIKEIYFFSIAVKKKYYKRLSYSLLHRVAHELELIRKKSSLRKLYATSATDMGEKVIDRLGFKIMQAGDKRADGHPLYYRVIDRIIDLRNYLYRMQEG